MVLELVLLDHDAHLLLTYDAKREVSERPHMMREE
jgi:hypothetical protein